MLPTACCEGIASAEESSQGQAKHSTPTAPLQQETSGRDTDTLPGQARPGQQALIKARSRHTALHGGLVTDPRAYAEASSSWRRLVARRSQLWLNFSAQPALIYVITTGAWGTPSNYYRHMLSIEGEDKRTHAVAG
ncbi:hypothetical protein WJX79_006131 [Trebouxia sp. C0005]